MEDLDLSIRAFACGWRFCYLNHVHSSGELPPTLPILKKQQFR